MESLSKSLFLKKAWGLSACAVGVLVVQADSLEPTSNAATAWQSNWEGKRTWIGPDVWANPLQSWSVSAEHVVVEAALGHNLQSLTRGLSPRPGDFSASVRVQLDPAAHIDLPGEVHAGFLLALNGSMDEPRNLLVAPNPNPIDMGPTRQLTAVLRADGYLASGELEVATDFDVRQPVELSVSLEPAPAQRDYRLVLSAMQNGRHTQLERRVPAEVLYGNLGLVAEAPRHRPDRGGDGRRREPVRWSFQDWKMDGSKLEMRPDLRFGPILWTQYTLSRGTLKVLAQFPPLDTNAHPAPILEIKRGGRWVTVDQAVIDPLSRTALFRLSEWKARTDVPYRVRYTWQGRNYFWEGTVRQEPARDQPLTMTAMSCDEGYAFPQPMLVRNAKALNPDLMFFAGDQIYENHGGFGVRRVQDTGEAMLDYLRKYFLFGWTWREMLKDRPSVMILDDHDYYQGNVWGEAGMEIDSLRWADGGYLMPPEWIRAVERIQTGHLPDPVDPQPVKRDIGVYFTDLNYGGVSFAILEDRKFKSAPNRILPFGEGTWSGVSPEELDVAEAELMGAHQEAFLAEWAQDWKGARFKAVLSQTLLAKATTHQGPDLRRLDVELDANAWPQSQRDRALDLIRRGYAYMIHGDQHLGIQAHLGIEDWRDSGVALMVPGTANGFPRAWWPEGPGGDGQTGNYRDGLNNLVTILAAGNPNPELAAGPKAWPRQPEIRAHAKGSGFGLVTFDPESGDIKAELFRYGVDALDDRQGAQFPGWPLTTNLLDNYAREAAAFLPEIRLQGEGLPVVQVVMEDPVETAPASDLCGSVLYTLRPTKFPFRPKVFAEGTYRILLSLPEIGWSREFSGLKAGPRSVITVKLPSR